MISQGLEHIFVDVSSLIGWVASWSKGWLSASRAIA
jgi:hypothetical protein